jgi:hypothetical protein
MLTVGELFKRLSFGPLSNLSMSNDGDGTIIGAKQLGLIRFANEGLLRLYTRFVLTEKEVILELDEAITQYRLSSEFSVSNGGPVQYLKDTAEIPFNNDVIKIMAAYSAAGTRYPLNDEHNCDSLFTPRVDTLQVPKPITGAGIHVLYQAKKVITTESISLSEVIDIPDVLDEALVAYISHKVYSSMNGQEHTAKSVELLGLFNSVCNDVEARDLVNSSLSFTNDKFSERGFV